MKLHLNRKYIFLFSKIEIGSKHGIYTCIYIAMTYGHLRKNKKKIRQK